MHQPRHWMLLARSLSLFRASSVVGVHASSMCEPRSRRMCVGGIDGSSIDPPSHRVRERPPLLDDRHQPPPELELLVVATSRHESSRQGRSSDVVESSVRDRCRRSHVPSDGADSEERERLGARSNVLGRVRASSRLLPSRVRAPRSPRRPPLLHHDDNDDSHDHEHE